MNILVAKLYPHRGIVACPCSEKGPDAYVTAICASWVRQCGIVRCTFMSDQEGAIRAMANETFEILKCTADWAGAVPENSAVGDSQSNGKAERAVRDVEDMLRCGRAELECNAETKFPVDHLISQWLVEYAAVALSKHHINGDGKTGYEHLHGQRADEQLACF